MLLFQKYEKGKSHMNTETEYTVSIKYKTSLYYIYVLCSKQKDIIMEMISSRVNGSDGFGNVKIKITKNTCRAVLYNHAN